MGQASRLPVQGALGIATAACLAWWGLAGELAPPPPTFGIAPDIPGDTIRLVVVGDVGEDTPVRTRVIDAIRALCAERGCDAGILTGDLVYPRGLAGPGDVPDLDPFLELGFPWYAVLGNHDYGHGLSWPNADHYVDWAARTAGVELPAPSYTAKLGPVRLVAVDTPAVFWGSAEPYGAWIDALPRDGSMLLAAHHPFVSEGKHGNAGAYEGLPGVPYAGGAELDALYANHVCGRFDLAVSGHDHSRQWIDACGTTWVVSGAGAKPSPLVGRGNDPVFASDRAGFVWIEVTPEGVRIAFHDTERVDFEETR